MITDTFFRRYPNFGGRYGHVQQFFNQAAQIFFHELLPGIKTYGDQNELCERALVDFSREAGIVPPASGQDYIDLTYGAIVEAYDLWNDAHGSENQFIIVRLSIVELLFRYFEEYVADRDNKTNRIRHPWALRRKNDLLMDLREIKTRGIEELNNRLAQNKIPFVYSAGKFISEDHDLVFSEIQNPYWALSREEKWKTVNEYINKALERKHNDDIGAIIYASMALESALKIISDTLGLTSGSERGAVNYIENLSSRRANCFLSLWEAELLKVYFKSVRNPVSHGSGSEEPPRYSLIQTSWAVGHSILWCKSLIGRT